jgi:hypothetical protein
MQSLSRLYDVDDKTTNENGAVGEWETERANQSTWGNARLAATLSTTSKTLLDLTSNQDAHSGKLDFDFSCSQSVGRLVGRLNFCWASPVQSSLASFS